jgi:hypothetical protein
LLNTPTSGCTKDTFGLVKSANQPDYTLISSGTCKSNGYADVTETNCGAAAMTIGIGFGPTVWGTSQAVTATTNRRLLTQLKYPGQTLTDGRRRAAKPISDAPAGCYLHKTNGGQKQGTKNPWFNAVATNNVCTKDNQCICDSSAPTKSQMFVKSTCSANFKYCGQEIKCSAPTAAQELAKCVEPKVTPLVYTSGNGTVARNTGSKIKEGMVILEDNHATCAQAGCKQATSEAECQQWAGGLNGKGALGRELQGFLTVNPAPDSSPYGCYRYKNRAFFNDGSQKYVDGSKQRSPICMCTPCPSAKDPKNLLDLTTCKGVKDAKGASHTPVARKKSTRKSAACLLALAR